MATSADKQPTQPTQAATNEPKTSDEALTRSDVKTMLDEAVSGMESRLLKALARTDDKTDEVKTEGGAAPEDETIKRSDFTVLQESVNKLAGAVDKLGGLTVVRSDASDPQIVAKEGPDGKVRRSEASFKGAIFGTRTPA